MHEFQEKESSRKIRERSARETIPIFVSTFRGSKMALREARGKILLETFTRSLNVTLPHGEYKFRSDAMETSSGRACRVIFSRFLRNSRQAGAETAASATV